MNNFERLEAVFTGKIPDRLPSIGGWMPCAAHITEIMGISTNEFWTNPNYYSVMAYKKLGIDGLTSVLMPIKDDDYRSIDHNNCCKTYGNMDFESFVQYVKDMQEPEKLEETLQIDFDNEYEKLKNSIFEFDKISSGLVNMPAQWGLGSYAMWYNEFGYENYFMLIGLYPQLAQKLFEISGVKGNFMSRLLVKAVKEGIYPHAVHMGEDLCTQRGSMISVDFLEKYYAPTLKYGLSPLKEIGCRPIWHSDGDIRQIIPMLLDSGIEGFQGFQSECGVILDDILKCKPKSGNKILIMGTISVTSDLVYMNPKQVKEKIRTDFEKCKGTADFVQFTSSSFGSDIPTENIYAMYEEVASCSY